jgi:hypothetical protein
VYAFVQSARSQARAWAAGGGQCSTTDPVALGS